MHTLIHVVGDQFSGQQMTSVHHDESQVVEELSYFSSSILSTVEFKQSSAPQSQIFTGPGLITGIEDTGVSTKESIEVYICALT